jgi:hypothetical protein
LRSGSRADAELLINAALCSNSTPILRQHLTATSEHQRQHDVVIVVDILNAFARVLFAVYANSLRCGLVSVRILLNWHWDSFESVAWQQPHLR